MNVNGQLFVPPVYPGYDPRKTVYKRQDVAQSHCGLIHSDEISIYRESIPVILPDPSQHRSMTRPQHRDTARATFSGTSTKKTLPVGGHL
jgi:hypothetical protein